MPATSGSIVTQPSDQGMVVILIVIFRFYSRRNPNPARLTHNTKIEIAWTLVPVVILIVIGSFSLPILFKQLEVPPPDLTIKATGNQWYWSLQLSGERRHLRQPDAAREDDLAAHGYPPETAPARHRHRRGGAGRTRSCTCW